MYVCVCRAVTKKEILNIIGEGADSVSELREKLKVTESCGSCLEPIRQFLKQANTNTSQAA